MIPHFATPVGAVATFPLFVVLGILVMFFLTSQALRATNNRVQEENYIFPKMVASGVVGFLTAGAFDSLCKITLYGKLEITGVTFYGGLIGVILALFLLLKLTQGESGYSLREWFDLLTQPFVAFHFFGRIGCFFGGCCYGKPTDGILGVVFPNNPEQGVIHNGISRYPTQLFEAAVLLIIFLLLFKRKNKFETYVFLYAVSRFVIEFFRGDERGAISRAYSPSQVVSIILLVIVLGHRIFIQTWQTLRANSI